MKFVFTLLIVFFSSQSFPESWKQNSAKRLKSENFENIYFKKTHETPNLRASNSAYNNAHPVEQLDFSKVTLWSKDELLYAFSRIRDERFINDKPNDKFPRRSSWLYPHDGCWARTALSAKRSAEWGLKRPNKLFVFGNLEVKTPNANGGAVTWWYHVVPVVRDEAGQPVVLDPAIEQSNYLPLMDWLKRMGDPSKMTLAVCNTYTYGPMDNCFEAFAKDETNASLDQSHYLPSEWKNLEGLDRNPSKELGDFPPWK